MRLGWGLPHPNNFVVGSFRNGITLRLVLQGEEKRAEHMKSGELNVSRKKTDNMH